MMPHILIVKILQKEPIADKILKIKAFDIAKDPKYDGHQRGLASMVYKFFDSKVSGSGAKLIPENEQLANELHKPIVRKFKKRKVYSAFKDNIWGADLADIHLLSKYNKGIRFLLCVLDIFSKYAWVVPLKGLNFIMLILKNGCETMILLCIQHIMKGNLLLLKDLLEH